MLPKPELTRVVAGALVLGSVAGCGPRTGGVATNGPAPGPAQRFGAAMAWDGATRQLILFGGMGARGPVGDTWEWSGTRWIEQHPRHAPPPRVGAGLAYNSTSRQLVLFGGSATTVTITNEYGHTGVRSISAQDYQDTWTWSGDDWIEQHPTVVPPRTATAMLADDVASGYLLLTRRSYDRFSTSETNLRWLPGSFSPSGPPRPSLPPTVWAWTGTTWQPLLAVSFTNFDAVAANDPASGHIVAFTVNYEHFEDRQCSLDDPSDIPPAVRSSPGAIVPLPIESCHAVGATWRWDGSTWVRVVTSNGPPDLPAAAMAGSAGLGTVLLDATGATWRWDAERWHQASSSGPGRRYGAAMAFDTATGQLILFGGYAEHQQLGDTWAWDGGSWAHAAGLPATPPPG